MTALSLAARSGGVLGAMSVAVLGLAISNSHRPMLIWNASASAPIGLYYVSHEPLARGSLVIATPQKLVAQFAAGRHYLPLGVPLIKPVAGVEGDTICAVGTSISIDGEVVAKQLGRDSRGHHLPHWRGCLRLDSGSVFLLNRNVSTSFDGRYFGPVPRSSILGTARPVWTR